MLVTIDPATGATSVVGPLGVFLMHGLAYDSNNDVLYGITNQQPTSALYRIDVDDGSTTLVGVHGKLGLTGLAFDAGTNTMYASEGFEQALYTIDLTDGSVNLVGP